MRANWWNFAMWHYGPSWRHLNWRLVYDLRHWMFGWRYSFGSWAIAFGPLHLEKLTTFSEPQKGSWLEQVK